MLFVNFTGRLLCSLEEQVDLTLFYVFSASSEERNGRFIPGLLCNPEFSSLPL